MTDFSHAKAILEHGANDYLVIRGVRIDLDKLVNRSFFEPEKIATFRAQLQSAKPFPHIVFEDLFDPKLLELVHEEFDLCLDSDWLLVKGKHEELHRSPPKPKLGSATQLYFSQINSGEFMDFLSEITGVINLISDPQFYGGGLHETHYGGRFEIHVDFNLHHQTMLDNEMVLITYLNRNWKPEYGGALELWDADTRSCIAEILPEFGRTVLFRHGLKSLHGHPKPLNAPEGRSRRSVAAYYYTNRTAKHSDVKRHSSLFFPNGKANRWDMVKEFGRYLLPLVVLNGGIKAFKRARQAKRAVESVSISMLSFLRRQRGGG